jgi:Ca2+-binding EF-hand superfamily protein
MKKLVLSVSFIVFASSLVVSQDRNQEIKRKAPPSLKQIFKDLDKNDDGKISLKEVKGFLKKDFKKIDTNKDDFLSKEEMKKAPKSKRRERKEN